MNTESHSISAGISSDGGDASREGDFHHRGRRKFNSFIRINKQRRSSTKYNNQCTRKRSGSRKKDDDDRKETEYEKNKRREIESLLAEQRAKSKRIQDDARGGNEDDGNSSSSSSSGSMNNYASSSGNESSTFGYHSSSSSTTNASSSKFSLRVMMSRNYVYDPEKDRYFKSVENKRDHHHHHHRQDGCNKRRFNSWYGGRYHHSKREGSKIQHKSSQYRGINYIGSRQRQSSLIERLRDQEIGLSLTSSFFPSYSSLSMSEIVLSCISHNLHFTPELAQYEYKNLSCLDFHPFFGLMTIDSDGKLHNSKSNAEFGVIETYHTFHSIPRLLHWHARKPYVAVVYGHKDLCVYDILPHLRHSSRVIRTVSLSKEDYVRCMEFVPGGEKLAIGSDHGLFTCQLEGNQILKVCSSKTPLSAICYGPSSSSSLCALSMNQVFCGLRNGFVYNVDVRSRVNNMISSSSLIGKMSSCLDHIHLLDDEHTLIAQDMTGDMKIFDVRKCGDKYNFCGKFRLSDGETFPDYSKTKLRSRKFWVSPHDEWLISQMPENKSMNGDSTSNVGIWSLRNFQLENTVNIPLTPSPSEPNSANAPHQKVSHVTFFPSSKRFSRNYHNSSICVNDFNFGENDENVVDHASSNMGDDCIDPDYINSFLADFKMAAHYCSNFATSSTSPTSFSPLSRMFDLSCGKPVS